MLSEFEPTSDIRLLTEGEKITVKNVGEKITDPLLNKSRKQIFANSWIYNTSSRFQVSSINGNNFVLFTSDIDKSSIKVGDEVQILFRNEENIAGTGVVKSVSPSTKTIDLDPLSSVSGGLFTVDPNRDYDIRRSIKTASSSTVDVEFGNNVLTADTTINTSGSTGLIDFSSTINNDGEGTPFDLTLNSNGGSITVDSTIGNSVAVKAIDINAGGGAGIITVSYTHLTLPTIYSV